MTEINQDNDSKRKVLTTWYLHAKDGHSNEVLSRAFDELQTVDTFKEHVCADGKSRHLYQVKDYSTASRFYKSQKQLHASFEIYRAKDDGTPDMFKFVTPKKPTLKSIQAKSDHLKLSATMPQHRKHQSAQ